MRHFCNLGPDLRFSAAFACALLLASTVLPASGDGGPVVLIDDMTPGTHDLGLDPKALSSAGDVVYFWGHEAPTGWELWRSDGTAAGTRRVSDFCPGSCSSAPDDPEPSLVLGGRVYFSACDDLPRCWLVASDGTPEGTIGLKDFVRLTFRLDAEGIGSVRSLVAYDGEVFFLATDEEHGLEMWRSDGTREGTVVALDLASGPEGSGLRDLAATDEWIFLAASDGLRAWDATTASPIDLPGPDPLLVRTAGGRLFFRSGSDGRLWSSDGTPEGTHALTQKLYPVASVAWRGELFFTSGGHVFRSDGTDEGTSAVLDFRPLWLAVSGDRLFLLNRRPHCTSADCYEILRLDHPSATPEVVACGNSELLIPDVVGLDGGLAVAARLENNGPWKLATIPASGGGPSAVRQEEEAESTSPVPLGGSKESLFYQGAFRHPTTPERATYYEVFSTRGAPGSTVFRGAHENLLLVPPRSVGDFLALGGDGLWHVEDDGSLRRLSDLFLFTETAAAVAGEVLFVASTPSPGAFASLWASEGGEPRKVKELSLWEGFPYCPLFPECHLPPNGGFVVDGEYYFGTEGHLWRSDGTEEGTHRFLDFRDVHEPADNIENLFRLGDSLVLNTVYTYYRERFLWRIDGSSEYPVPWRHLRLPIGPPEAYPYPRPIEMAVLGGEVFFADGTPETGVELWKSDGTEAGTSLVLDLRRGSASSHPRDLLAVGGRLYFAADDGISGHELWSTDGTAEGTVLVADVFPGPESSYPRELTTVEVEVPGGETVRRLLFAARGATGGLEPWTSDGTTTGTRRLQDVVPGPMPSTPSRFFALEENVYLSAWSEEAGFELHGFPREALLEECAFEVSPSSAALPAVGGTVEVAVEADEGCLWDATSAAGWIVAGGGSHDGTGTVELLVASNDGEARAATVTVAGHGFAVTQEAAPVVEPCPECLLDGRFTVEVRWKNPRMEGQEGPGTPIPFSDESVLFYFFKESNVELIVKVLDGRGTNGHFWVFYGGLTDVEYAITVTDTETGEARSYHNPPGEICGGADVRAF